jgi:hypothetical protein
VRRHVLLLVPLVVAVAAVLLLLLVGRDGVGVAPEPPPPAPPGVEPPAGLAPRPTSTPPPPAAPATGTPISGRVRDEDGAPVVGAEVVAVAESDVPGVGRLRREATDAEGRFSIEDAAPGAWTLSVSAAEFVPATVGAVAAGRTDVEVTLSPRGWIEATVLGPDGAPWPGEVSLVVDFVGFAAGGAPAESVPGGPQRTQAGARADGLHRVRGLPSGLWRVAAKAAGDPPLVSVGLGVDTVVIDGRPSPVSLRLVRAGRLEGVIADPAGAPVAGAVLHLRIEGRPGSGGALDAVVAAPGDGFAVDQLAAGTWVVVGRASNGGWIRDRVVVPVGEVVRKDLVAQPSGSVRVRLLYDDGTPVVGVRVVLATEDGLWQEPDPRTRAAGDLTWLTDSDGVHFRGAAPSGRLRVTTIPDRRHGPAPDTVVEVPAGGRGEVELVVPRAPRPR